MEYSGDDNIDEGSLIIIMRKILFADFHANIHHEQMADIEAWLKQAKEMTDFWPIAYYPYYMRQHPTGAKVEDVHDMDKVNEDWLELKHFIKENNTQEYPIFLGYEWQGSGLDGDHNIFFKDDGDILFPLRYETLNQLLPEDAIAIPHHLAYQLNHRGKNWETQDDKRSPFVEIYSSHGSSENGYSNLHMDRHIHMGPRTGHTSVMNGLNQGHEVGIIASGDNHIAPASFGHGLAAVIVEDDSKEAIWEALLAKRVYGVSANKILLDYQVDGYVMGSKFIQEGLENKHHISVVAGDAIDRVELVSNGRVIDTFVHNGQWVTQPLPKNVRFKFKIEHGWGPDTRVFPDIHTKIWKGEVQTSGRIISVEKCWSRPGQSIIYQDDQRCSYQLTTYKSDISGKWMGPSPITSEGFIFEIEAELDSNITFTIDQNTYTYSVQSLLEDTNLITFYEEAKALVAERLGLEDYYRSDPFYHHAYKVRLLKAVPQSAYELQVEFKTLPEKNKNYYYIKVIQQNGELAWSSPIWICKK